jgi:hypothetical protein
LLFVHSLRRHDRDPAQAAAVGGDFAGLEVAQSLDLYKQIYSLGRLLPPEDHAERSRWGGEEFVFLMHGRDLVLTERSTE